MGHLAHAVLHGNCHLVVGGVGMPGRNGHAAPQAFVDQPQVFGKLRGQRHQAHQAGFQELHSFRGVGAADEGFVLRAAAHGVQIRPFKMDA